MHSDRELSPIGYSWLALRYKINPIPHCVCKIQDAFPKPNASSLLLTN